MDDDDDFFGPVIHVSAPPPRRFRKADLLVMAADFAHGVVDAAASNLLDLRNVLAMHANYEVDRERFHEQAAWEIETLVSGDTDE